MNLGLLLVMEYCYFVVLVLFTKENRNNTTHNTKIVSNVQVLWCCICTVSFEKKKLNKEGLSTDMKLCLTLKEIKCNLN